MSVVSLNLILQADRPVSMKRDIMLVVLSHRIWSGRNTLTCDDQDHDQR
jgi:hypothetical protein